MKIVKVDSEAFDVYHDGKCIRVDSNDPSKVEGIAREKFGLTPLAETESAAPIADCSEVTAEEIKGLLTS